MDQNSYKQSSFNLHLPSFLIGVGLTLLIGAMVYLLVNKEKDTSANSTLKPPVENASQPIDTLQVTAQQQTEEASKKETEEQKKHQEIELRIKEQKLSRLIQQNQQYSEEVSILETEMTLISYIKNYVSDPVNKEELIPANVGISDAGIQSMIASYNSLVNRYKRMKQTDAYNPNLGQIRQQIDNERKAINSSVDELLNTARERLNNARKQHSKIQAQIVSLTK